jgi:hypothetical protein
MRLGIIEVPWDFAVSLKSRSVNTDTPGFHSLVRQSEDVVGLPQWRTVTLQHRSLQTSFLLPVSLGSGFYFAFQ